MPVGEDGRASELGSVSVMTVTVVRFSPGAGKGDWRVASPVAAASDCEGDGGGDGGGVSGGGGGGVGGDGGLWSGDGGLWSR